MLKIYYSENATTHTVKTDCKSKEEMIRKIKREHPKAYISRCERIS